MRGTRRLLIPGVTVFAAVGLVLLQTGVNEGNGFVGLTYVVDPGCAAAEPVVRAPTFTG